MLYMNRGLDSLDDTSSISYLLEGIEGERIFKLQWKNLGFCNECWANPLDCNSYANFQIWLYESNNTIAFHYGPVKIIDYNLILEDRGLLVGLFGNYNLDEDLFSPDNIYLSGDPSNPDIDYYLDPDPDSIPYLLNYPKEGTVYSFSLVETNTQNVQNEVYEMTLSPNPATDFIQITSVSEQIISTQIYNVYGQRTKALLSHANRINVANLNAGVYTLKAELINGRCIIKNFIKN